MRRVALITGGSRGIGKSFARALLAADHDVIITAARGSDALAHTAAELATAFGAERILAFLCDAGDPRSAANAAQSVMGHFGRIDILVNNAGRGPREIKEDFHVSAPKFWDIDPAGWSEILQTNVTGPFLMSRAVAPHMVDAGWGRIINISTSRTTMVKQGNAPYGPSKAALDAMTRLFADDLHGTGVTVNSLAPGGPTETDFFARTGRTGAYLDMLPVDVMDAALLWLCSDAAAQITAGRFIGKLWQSDNPDAAREDTGEAPRIL